MRVLLVSEEEEGVWWELDKHWGVIGGMSYEIMNDDVLYAGFRGVYVY